MPWLMVIYVVFIGLIVFINLGYLISVKCKPLVMLYELFAGLFLLGMMFSYWIDVIDRNLNWLVIPAYILILIVDMKVTIFKDFDELGIELPEEMTEQEIELAGAVSLIFAAPAYIIAGLVCLRFLFDRA